jgi:phosphonate transport system substrate-binding protein
VSLAVQHRQFARRHSAALVAWLSVCCALLSRAADSPAATAAALRPFRMAIISSMFSEVNESDARAAMKVWIMTVAKEHDFAVDPDLHVFSSIDELLTSCRTNTLDGAGVLATEFARLQGAIQFDRLGVAEYGGKITEQYLLLVRQDSGLERLEQLQGRTLNVLNTPRMSLATVWLDTALMHTGLTRCSTFFGRINYNGKASMVTLPVFFHQADACLTTSNSFKLMGELNPQLTKQMRALAFSPEVMPACFAFSTGNAPTRRSRIFEEMPRLHETPAGKQILTLLQADRFVDVPVSSMDGSLALLAEHARLCGETNKSGVTTK